MTLLHVNNKGADQSAHLSSLISILLFAIWKVEKSNLHHAKFHWSNLSLQLSRLVWTIPGWKPWRQVLSRHSQFSFTELGRSWGSGINTCVVVYFSLIIYLWLFCEQRYTVGDQRYSFCEQRYTFCEQRSQELEVRSLNHPYSLKTKSSQCHYVVMTRSETKFQAPLNRCYQDVFAKMNI